MIDDILREYVPLVLDKNLDLGGGGVSIDDGFGNIEGRGKGI